METTVYDQVGGSAFFVTLVDVFYAGVADDALLRPLYPEADLEGARARLTGFLVQYWGGPTTYSDERGHPRLRMRHQPYAIGVAERDAWFGHMAHAVDVADTTPEISDRLLTYFAQAADHLINVAPS